MMGLGSVAVFGLAFSAAAAPVQLELMGAFPQSQPAGKLLYQYAAEYHALHPDITIVQTPRTGSDQEAMEKIYTSIAAGVAPGIVYIPQVFLTDYVHKGVVAPMPTNLADVNRDIYLPAALSLASYQGKRYGFPTESQPQALAYNSAVFAQAGLPDAPPKTWDQLRQMAQKITIRDAGGKVERAGYGILTYATPVAGYLLSYSWDYGGSPISADLRRVDFAGDASVAAVQFLKDLLDDGAAVKDLPGFTTAKLGMFFAHGPWQASGFRQAGAEFYNGLRSALPPAGSTGSPNTTFYGYLVAVTPYSKHPAEAYAFLDWLCTEITPQGTTRMGNVMEALGSMPNTFTDARNQPSMREPFMQGFLQGLESGAAHPIPPIPSWLDSFGELSTEFVAALDGKLPAKAAMTRADQVIQAKFDAFYKG